MGRRGVRDAAALADEGLRLLAAGRRLGIADALYHLGTVAELQGDDEQAEPLYERALARYREVGDRRWTANAARASGIPRTDRATLRGHGRSPRRH